MQLSCLFNRFEKERKAFIRKGFLIICVMAMTCLFPDSVYAADIATSQPTTEASTETQPVTEAVATEDTNAIPPEQLLDTTTAPSVSCGQDIQKKVKIKWKKVKNATKYVVYRATKSNGSYKKIATVTGLSYIDKKAKARKTYYYKVQAVQQIMRPDGSEFKNTGKKSKNLKVYVRPKKPKMVICGECYVEGIQYFTPEEVPSNMNLVSKVGLNTTNLLSYPYYEGYTAMDKVVAMKPDRVYFLVGANEFMNNTPDYTVKNFNKMRKILQKKNKNVEIVIMKISPQGRSGKGGVKVAARAKYNNAYKNFAKKYTNVYFCNATDVLDDGYGTLNPLYDGGDGCHWTSRGTKQVMIALRKWSKKKLGTW